jgi:UDP-N-acetylmuramate--alanine ligase
MESNFSAVVLAAGKGKRMKASLTKVLHKIAGKTMLERTINILESINPTQITIVVNPMNNNSIRNVFKEKCSYVIQKKALGTADAAKLALSTIAEDTQTVGVFYGDDTALYKPETIREVLELHLKKSAKITFVTVIKNDPTGLGRIIRERGKLKAIVEEKDATVDQHKIKEVNDGIYFFERKWLGKNIQKLKTSKATGELYLTDLIELALSSGENVETYCLEDEGQWHGINNTYELAEANLKVSKNIHFMGISGAGASAVAGISESFGYNVSGCDLNIKSPYTEKLLVPVTKGHDPSHLKDIALLIVSPAVLIYDKNNKEIKEAKRQGIPVLTWQEFQGKILQKEKFVIAIAGAYGKSTTTAMVSKILIDAGLDPTCEIGASVLDWGNNFRVGKSKYYICEADEYFNNFLSYTPDISVILNMAWEHPDFFKTEGDLVNSYIEFAKKTRENGSLIISAESRAEFTKKVSKEINLIKVESFNVDGLMLIGDFRKENADFALTIAKVLNLDIGKAISSVRTFSGLARRLEHKGNIKGVHFYDDYAVQPYTIRKTTNALKDKFKNQRLLLVLEPHMYSRVSRFFDDFVKGIRNTKIDTIYITDVFAAREKRQGSNLSMQLAESIGPKARYTGSIEKTASLVAQNLGKYDCICSMGAGDSYKLYDLVKKENG